MRLRSPNSRHQKVDLRPQPCGSQWPLPAQHWLRERSSEGLGSTPRRPFGAHLERRYPRAITGSLLIAFELFCHFDVFVFSADPRCLVAGDSVGNPLRYIAVE
jgi:hypothetical protein